MVYKETIDVLTRRLAELEQKGAEFEGRDGADSLQLEFEALKEQLEKLQRLHFGRSSERDPSGSSENTDKGEKEKEKQERKGHGPRSQPKLPLVETIHELDEADMTCPKCDSSLVEMGSQFEESEEISYQPPKIVLFHHKRQKYRCNCCGHIDTALGPAKLIAGGRYSISFAVHVGVAKYLDHLPLERQVRQMARQGLEVSAQTLFDQLYGLVGHVLPTYQAIQLHLLEGSYIHVDETTLPMLDSKNSPKWCLWSLSTHEMVFYSASSSRNIAVAGLLLEGFNGTLQTDGLSTYASLLEKGVRATRVKSFVMVAPDGSVKTVITDELEPTIFQFEHALCWAHLRRKFFDCKKNFYLPSREILDLIQELYKVEKKAKKQARARAGPQAKPAEQYEALLIARAQRRKEDSKPIVEKIHAWLNVPRALPGSSLMKAAVYGLKRWKGLTLFLDHPEVDLDNNAAERSLRGPVVGRKNYQGIRSPRGAVVAAVLYTLFETAKLYGLEPAAYVQQVVNNAIRSPGQATMPWDCLPTTPIAQP